MDTSPMPMKYCKIQAFVRQQQPLSKVGSLLCHTCCNTVLRSFGLIRHLYDKHGPVRIYPPLKIKVLRILKKFTEPAPPPPYRCQVPDGGEWGAALNRTAENFKHNVINCLYLIWIFECVHIVVCMNISTIFISSATRIKRLY